VQGRWKCLKKGVTVQSCKETTEQILNWFDDLEIGTTRDQS
jgi:hypothetical protein